MACPKLVRRTVLRQRRHGESDQGAVHFVCRSGQCGDDASESTAAVLIGDGLRAGKRIATAGSEGDRTGRSASGYHPDQAAQDRRADPCYGATSAGFVVFQFPVPAPVPAGVGESTLLKTSAAGSEIYSDTTGGTPGSDQCVRVALPDRLAASWN